MARTVKVALQAEVGQFKRGIGESERAAKKLADALDDVDGSGLDAAAVKAKGLGDAVGDAAGRAKGDLDDIGQHAQRLNQQIRDTESGMRSLAKGFAATGDPKILAAWREQSRLLGGLKKIQKFMPEPAEAAAAGLSLGQRLGDGITKSVPPQMSQALVAGGIAASPFLAATLVGAVTGGAGLMGIGGGVALALRDPKIKAEAKNLGAFIDAQMRSSFGDFGPAMIRSIGIVRTKIADLRDEFDRIGDNSAQHLTPLVESVAAAVGDIVEGLDRVIAEAGPTMLVIGDGIEGIGQKAEEFLSMIADNSGAGAKALHDLFTIIEFGLQSLTVTVDVLATAYKWGTAWTMLIPGMGKSSEDFGKSSEKAGGGVGILGQKVEETGKKTEVAKVKFEALEDALAAIAERNMSAAEANIAMRSSVEELAKAVDHKSAVTDKEMTALISFARTANSATKALDDQGRTVDEATRAHEANRKKLIDTAMQMGKSRAEAVRLADQYLAMPKGVATVVNQPGMARSREETKRYHAQLDSITRSIKTSVTVSGDTVAYAKLEKLLVSQQALKKGIPISAAQAAFNKNAYADGGWTGPGSKYQEAGVVHADEWVIQKESQRKIQRSHPGVLEHMNRYGEIPGYAAGGLVAPFPVNASVTRIPSYKEAMSAVTPAVPSGGRTSDWIVATAKALVPGIRVLSKDRPGARTLSGNVSYHARGRAVDFEPSKKLAQLWNERYMGRTKELISPYQQYNIHNSKRHSYTGAVWNQHNFAGGNAHDHIAMSRGGVIGEPVVGVGRSGTTYSFAERGAERVLSHAQTMAGAGGGTTIALTVVNHGVIGSRSEADDFLAGGLDRLKRAGRLP